MTDKVEPRPAPPCALLVMCNECGRGVEAPLPITQESFPRFLALQAWFMGPITPPGQVPVVFAAICGECAAKTFPPQILQAAEAHRQKLIQGTP